VTPHPETLLAIGLPLFLAVLGARLLIINRFGTEWPFWDQWDVEGPLIDRWLTGTLHASHLLDMHNEHRLLLPRLLTLAEFLVSGRWDGRVEAAGSACLMAGLALGLWMALVRLDDGRRIRTWAWFVTPLVTLPFGWENTVTGLQSQFPFP
jgi:hypothetical protein